MFRDFGIWWIRQMAALLPGWLRSSSAAEVMVLTRDPVGLAVMRRRRGQVRIIGRVPLDGEEAELAKLLRRRRSVPLLLQTGGPLLQRDVTLPLAAEARVARVLQYEMDRLTPFRSDDVFWDWARLRRDPAQGRLHLRLWLLPRAALQPVTEVLARLKQVPDLLEAATPDGTMRMIRLRQPPSGQRTALRLAGAACAALATVAIALPFIRQSLAGAVVESQIAALRTPVAEAAALRRRSAAGGEAMAAENARLGDPVAALVTVTQALPDDTYLTEFTMRQRRLRLGGESLGAAALIPLLAADRQFRNPAFAAPVTRSDTGRADLFVIQAEWVPLK